MGITYESLSKELHQRFPELATAVYTGLVGNINVDDEPFILYGVLFNRYLMNLVKTNRDASKSDVANFLEEMSASPDSHVTFLLNSEILPTFVKDQEILDSFWSFLGPSIRRRLRVLPPPSLLANVSLP